MGKKKKKKKQNLEKDSTMMTLAEYTQMIQMPLVQNACKECPQPAVDGNYGYCVNHRNPETKEIYSQAKPKQGEAFFWFCKECSERAVVGNYGYCLNHRDLHKGLSHQSIVE